MASIVCNISKTALLIVCLTYLRAKYSINFFASFMVLTSVLSWAVIGYLEGYDDHSKRN